VLVFSEATGALVFSEATGASVFLFAAIILDAAQQFLGERLCADRVVEGAKTALQPELKGDGTVFSLRTTPQRDPPQL
jgi:hypothetical protein